MIWAVVVVAMVGCFDLFPPWLTFKLFWTAGEACIGDDELATVLARFLAGVTAMLPTKSMIPSTPIGAQNAKLIR